MRNDGHYRIARVCRNQRVTCGLMPPPGFEPEEDVLDFQGSNPLGVVFSPVRAAHGLEICRLPDLNAVLRQDSTTLWRGGYVGI